MNEPAKTLSDRVVIVTGASRGIGREIALALGSRGAAVIVAAKTEKPRDDLPGTIHRTAQDVESAGGRAVAVAADVRDESALERIVDVTIDRFGHIDGLVNNAGALWWRPVAETPAKRFDLVMAVNLRASFLLSRLVADSMVASGRSGHIIMMAPPLDTEPHPGSVAYTISKLGMTMTALGLAEELRQHRIAVNSLWPATMVESLATINWGLGDRSQWRKPAILADATLAILGADPGALTGRQLIDEDYLRECGVTDFTGYRVDPDVEPPRFTYSEISRLDELLGG